MTKQDAKAARETLAPLTDQQVKETMEEGDYWFDLIYKVDEEIQRLENLAKPDEAEATIRQKLEQDPSSLDSMFELASLLNEKGRGEETIDTLL